MGQDWNYPAEVTNLYAPPAVFGPNVPAPGMD